MAMDCGSQFCTMSDFGGTGLIPLFKAVVNAIPEFFSISLFVIWIFGAGGIYFSILKATGKKRIWHSLTAMAFVCFLGSLTIAAMNEATFTFLSGYWVGFYILMTAASYYMLSNYK